MLESVKSSDLLNEVFALMKLEPERIGIDDYTSCIVGVALYNMGFSDDQLVQLNEYGFIDKIFEHEDRIFGLIEFIDDGGVKKLRDIQNLQDAGVEWFYLDKEFSNA